MYFVLHETIQTATDELSEFFGKPRSKFSAESLIPYLALVLTTTYHELYFAHQS